MAQITLTADVDGRAITCMCTADKAIRTLALWLFPPGIQPEGYDQNDFDPADFKTQTWVDIRNERIWQRPVRPPLTFRKLITATMRKQPGTYTFVAVAGAQTVAATVEVR